tara:strand:+ start:4859 stop:5659 length:801 start_codon:yes stop_codon:yes gene_type:complete
MEDKLMDFQHSYFKGDTLYVDLLSNQYPVAQIKGTKFYADEDSMLFNLVDPIVDKVNEEREKGTDGKDLLSSSLDDKVNAFLDEMAEAKRVELENKITFFEDLAEHYETKSLKTLMEDDTFMSKKGDSLGNIKFEKRHQKILEPIRDLEYNKMIDRLSLSGRVEDIKQRFTVIEKKANVLAEMDKKLTDATKVLLKAEGNIDVNGNELRIDKTKKSNLLMNIKLILDNVRMNHADLIEPQSFIINIAKIVNVKFEDIDSLISEVSA